MVEERIIIEISDEELDAAIEKADRGLKEVSLVQNRLISMLPGLREARVIVTQIQTLMGATPSVATLLIILQLVKFFIDQQRRSEEREREYITMVREARGFKSREEAEKLIESWNRDIEESHRGY